MELLKKPESFENICIKTIEEIDDNKVETIMNKKDEIILTTCSSKNNNTTAWRNLETDEWIMIEENSKTWIMMPQNGEKEEFNYSFIRYERYNNSKCVVVETTTTGEYTDVDGKSSLITTTQIWVDLKTGVALKIENKNNMGEEYTAYATVTLNKVKDEDVAKPNLDEYTEYKYEENAGE